MYYGFSLYDSYILIGICSKVPTFNSTDSYSSMFIDALVTLPRKWR